MSLDDQKSLEVLRQIFLSDSLEKQSELEQEISDLKFKITDKQSVIESFYPIITDLIERKIIDSEDEFIEALSPLMGKSIKKQFHDSKDEIIDALYPIMGQAIKKSVSESIKELYTSLNQKIDNALRKGIFSKKIKSKISGVSTTDILLQDSFPFLIKEVFLIHEASGLLISHVSSSDKVKTEDADLVSGMLTAIKDFVAESFKSDSGSENLYEIQYGDSKIVLERGRHTYFAVVYSGQEPTSFSEKLTLLSDTIHDKYNDKLRGFDGTISELHKIDVPIQKFIDQFDYVNQKVERDKPRPVLLYLVLGILSLALIIFGIFNLPRYFQQQSMDRMIFSELNRIPNLDMNNISWVDNDGTISLSGFVKSEGIRNRVDSVVRLIADEKSVNNELGILFEPVSTDVIVKQVKNIFLKFRASDAKSEIDNDKVILKGSVRTKREKREIAYQVAEISGVRMVINNLIVKKNASLSDSESEELLGKLRLYFGFDKTEVTKNHISKLDSIVPYLRRNQNLSFKVKGYSDNIGTDETKLWIAEERANHVANYLMSQGILETQLEIESLLSGESDSLEGNLQRRVEFEEKVNK